jgi:ubiquinone/menaquinone biosynthesis C-methylase UbiE
VFAESNGQGVIPGDAFASTRAKITSSVEKDRASARILDLGTGLGFQAGHLWGAGYRNVFACDLVPSRIALARKLHARTGVQFLIGDMQSLGIGAESLDAITISAVLHDFSGAGVKTVLAECGRALWAQGRLVVMEPRYLGEVDSALHRWAYRWCGRLLDESLCVDEFLNFDLADWVGRTGFTLLRRELA